jgi:hypothetical protein
VVRRTFSIRHQIRPTAPEDTASERGSNDEWLAWQTIGMVGDVALLSVAHTTTFSLDAPFLNQA